MLGHSPFAAPGVLTPAFGAAVGSLPPSARKMCDGTRMNKCRVAYREPPCRAMRAARPDPRRETPCRKASFWVSQKSLLLGSSLPWPQGGVQAQRVRWPPALSWVAAGSAPPRVPPFKACARREARGVCRAVRRDFGPSAAPPRGGRRPRRGASRPSPRRRAQGPYALLQRWLSRLRAGGPRAVASAPGAPRGGADPFREGAPAESRRRPTHDPGHGTSRRRSCRKRHVAR